MMCYRAIDPSEQIQSDGLIHKNFRGEGTMDEQIRLFEELTFNSHPALQTQFYDGWFIRYSGGYTNRANSVSTLWPSTLDVNAKIEECEKRYARQSLPCVFKVTDGSEPGFDRMLEERGYRIVTPTDLMTLDLRGRQFARGDCVITDHVTREWLDTYFTLENYPEPKRVIAEQMLRSIRNEARYCRIVKDGQSIACASAVLERGYVTLVNVIVNEAYRGRGYGRQLCESLLSEAIKADAHTAYLQVVQSNSTAVRLYEKIGFCKLYSYWYRVK